MTRSEFNSVWLPLNANLYRVAYYILENEQDARDEVQNLYVKLWIRRDSLDSVGNPLAYSIRLIKNQCIDRLRQSQHRQSESLEAVDRAEASLPDEEVTGKEDLQRVRRYIEDLPERQRTLLKMKVIEELDYDEIAERTGLSKVNIRVCLSLARKTLKNRMEVGR